MTYIIEVEPVCVEQGTIKIRSKTAFILRKFQEKTIDFFSSPSQYLFLTAPTGSGKTLTLLAPLLSNVLHGTNYDGVLGIYPTKPLTVDQFESIKTTLGRLSVDADRAVGSGLVVCDLEFDVEKDGTLAGRYRGRVGLVLLTRDNIERLKDALGVESGQSVLDAVRRDLLAERVDYLMTLAVPEYPYLMFSHMYRSHHDLAKLLDLASSGGFVYEHAKKMLQLMDSEDELRRLVERVNRLVKALVEGRVAERLLADIASGLLPPVIFFDEFHTWGFYELPTAIALVLLHRLVSLTSTRREMYRVVFSSATPNQYVLDLLSKVAGSQAIRDVRAEITDCAKAGVAKIRGKTTVELFSFATRSSGYPSWIKVEKFLPIVVKEKSREILSSMRAIVLGRRVFTVEEAAKCFYAETGAIPTVVTGFTPPTGFRGKEELVARKSDGELYVFGNYAVELGVDLQSVTYSIVTATSLGELLQRIGRSGRGGLDSKVVVLVPESYAEVIMSRLGGKGTVSYADLVNALSWVMEDEPLIKKLGNKIVLKGVNGRLRLYLPLATYVLVSLLRFRDKPKDLEPVLREFEKVLQVVNIDKCFFSWLRRRVSKNPRVLVEIASFRLSPSVPYVRAGSGNQVDGEANPITLLSNYKVSVDTSGGFKLVIHDTMKSDIGKIATLEIRSPRRDVLRSISGSVLPSRLVLELLRQMDIAHTLLAGIIDWLNTPLYVIYMEEEDPDFQRALEALHVYGHAIALEHSGEVYAYLLLL